MRGTSKKLVFPKTKQYQSSGIEISYIKRRDVLYITGFYDGGWAGIEGTEITVKDFCERLGIQLFERG